MAALFYEADEGGGTDRCHLPRVGQRSSSNESNEMNAERAAFELKMLMKRLNCKHLCGHNCDYSVTRNVSQRQTFAI